MRTMWRTIAGAGATRLRHDVASATAKLRQPASDAARDSIAAAAQIAGHTGSRGEALLTPAEHAFVNGRSTSLLAGACVLLAASAIIALLAPRREDVTRMEGPQAVPRPQPSAVAE